MVLTVLSFVSLTTTMKEGTTLATTVEILSVWRDFRMKRLTARSVHSPLDAVS
jgi:hypothetical protein